MQLKVSKQRIVDAVADHRERILYELCDDEYGVCSICAEVREQIESCTAATLFQAQLIQLNACLAGRAAVGDKTAREFWETTDRPDFMWWLADQLGLGSSLRSCFGPSPVPGPDAAMCRRIRETISFEMLREASVGR